MAPTKFTPEVRERYLEYLRAGNMKYEAARLVGIHPVTVERRRKDDPEFRAAEVRALDESVEGVEKILRDMALQGDIGAIKMFLAAHKRNTYGDRKTFEIDATPAALELGKAEAYAKIAELQTELAKRSQRLQLDDPNIIDVE